MHWICTYNFYFLSPNCDVTSDESADESADEACDVTLRTRKQKLNLQIERQLSYLMMPILNGICQYKRKYAVLSKNICHCLGPIPTGISDK